MRRSTRRRDDLPFDWARETARHVGTVAHRLFAQIAREGLAAWDAARIDALRRAFATELAAEGVDDARARRRRRAGASTPLRAMLADPRGRWLFDPAHADARSEWALAGVDGGAIVHASSSTAPSSPTACAGSSISRPARTRAATSTRFSTAKRERYRAQLERYARIVRALDARPIRLALYYPLQGGWREWPYDVRAAPSGAAKRAEVAKIR